MGQSPERGDGGMVEVFADPKADEFLSEPFVLLQLGLESDAGR